jgi:putative PIN family toxin of toxin-antitoxin system
MKIFIDSNVLIAAYISHGACYDLYGHCLDKHIVYSSEFVRLEVLEKLAKKIRLAEEKVQWAYQHLCLHTQLVSEAQLKEKICRDKDDDHIIAAAISADVDCIVSGDDDLLVLKKVHTIPIISPRDFWKFEENYSRFVP